MSQILLILQQLTEDPGLVGKLLQERGFCLDLRCPAQGETLPTTLDNHKAVVIFGGSMSANDDEKLPVIRAELDWIPLALDSGKPLLGICLGAQLLARTLGATIAPAPDPRVEIGYFPIQPTTAGQEQFQKSMYVYQWHREGFELPTDAVLLATGETFPNQAFRYGKTAYGFQFHPEITEATIRKWTAKSSERLAQEGAQSLDEQLEKHSLYAPVMENWLEGFFDNWLSLKEKFKDYPSAGDRPVSRQNL